MKTHLNSSLSTNSLWIMATTLVNAGLGYGYWMAVSHLFAPELVGFATGLIALMTVTSLVSNLGLVTVVIHRLPERRAVSDWSSTLTASVVGGGLLGAAAAGIVLAALPVVSPDLSDGVSPGVAALFVVGTAAWTVSSVLDCTFIAERASRAMTARNALFGAVKIPLVAAPLISTAISRDLETIFGSWVAACVISSGLALWLFIPRLRPGARLAFAGIVREARAMTSLLGGNYLVTLGNTLPTFLLPLVVASRVSVTDNAYFYMTWLVGGIFFTISSAIGSSLFAEGSHQPLEVGRHLTSSARLTAMLLAPVMLFVFLTGGWLLGLFGQDYADKGTGLLLILTASAVPDAITNLYVAVLRVQRRLRAAATLALGMATIAVAGGWVLAPQHGLVGVGVAWLVSQSVGSLWVARDAWAQRQSLHLPQTVA